MIVQDETQREALREAGKRLGTLLQELSVRATPGVSADALNDYTEARLREWGDTPAFLGYAPEGAPRPYPAALCLSINDEVVHGIPNESPKTLRAGDIVTLDLGLIHEGVIVDAAVTVPVGAVSPQLQKLLYATEEALTAGVAAAHPGGHVGDISHAVQTVVERAGFTVVKSLGGHGVGASVHEEPFIPNFGAAGTGPELREGMVLAIEPIVSTGKAALVLGSDGYTYRTKDGSPAAHFEHTVLIEKDGARILTAPSVV